MIRTVDQYLLRAGVLLLAVLMQACVGGTLLMTGPAGPADLQGTYSLYLYGCHYPEDIKNVAFLVPEGSTYAFEIYDLPTSYQVKRGVAGQLALSEAETFARCSTHRVNQTQIRRVKDAEGGTVAFEIRPLYFPLEFGQLDVMFVTYTLRDGTIRTTVRLDPDVERALESSGSDHRGRAR